MAKKINPLGTFEKYLSLWIGLSIVIGIISGYFFTSIFSAIAKIQLYDVNIIVALLIWLMIFPMMVNIDYSSIGLVKNNPRGIVVTLIVNWGLKPFSMALIGILFLLLILYVFPLQVLLVLAEFPLQHHYNVSMNWALGDHSIHPNNQ